VLRHTLAALHATGRVLMTTTCLYNLSTTVRNDQLRAAAQRRVLDSALPSRRLPRVHISLRPRRSLWVLRQAGN
jgi:hypothetical protein